MNTKRIAGLLLPALILATMIACRFVTGILPEGETATAPLPLAETVPAGQPVITAAPTSPALPQPAQTPIPTAPPALTSANLAAAEYCLHDLAYYHEYFAEVSEQGCFQLENGRLTLESPADSMIRLSVSLLDKYAFGDLDGDSDEDAVAVLAYNSGGSGTFILLAALINESGQPSHHGAFYLGDRVIVEQVQYEGGQVAVNFIGHGPADPMCCPTQPVSMALVYRQGALVDAAADQVGPYAEKAILALQARDMTALTQLVHPQWGLRFSPYSFVRDDNLVFSAGQIGGLLQDKSLYQWGWYDGSGAPIQLTFSDYYDRFVYSLDFAAAPQISYNQRLGYGNTIDNSREFYPGGVVVEYYYPGQDPQYGGMDWHSLRLVFQPEGDRWYLVGIINDEWTI